MVEVQKLAQSPPDIFGCSFVAKTKFTHKFYNKMGLLKVEESLNIWKLTQDIEIASNIIREVSHTQPRPNF